MKIKLIGRWYHGERGDWAPGTHEVEEEVGRYLVDTMAFIEELADGVVEKPKKPDVPTEPESMLDELVKEGRPKSVTAQIVSSKPRRTRKK